MKEKQAPEADAQIAQHEDHHLIRACLAGDSAAWETLVARYQRLVYSIPLKARLSADDAADIFQSVWLKLYEKLASLRDHEKLASWLITTTTREVWRVAARHRRERTQAIADSDDHNESHKEIAAPTPLADAERELLEQQQLVREAIESLPERCRQLLTMLFYEKDESSYADIGGRLGMPVSSVGPTRARCLEKMKKLLQGRL
jgi:RNA polymerase sigma factor (sigma-70 family)